MANNEIKPFATGANANVTPQGEWENLPALLTGFSSGKASSAQVNKAIRQASFVAATLAQFITDQSGEDVLDDGDQAGLLAKMLSAINKTSQPLDETLVALAALATGSNKLPYFTGNDTASVTDLTATGRNLIGKGSIADVLSYLGLDEIPGRLLNVQIFTSSGTYTPTAGTKKIIIEAVSGGGGGGSAINTSAGQSAIGNGGVSGEYVRTPLLTAQAQNISVGSPGAGGTAGNPGGAGGATVVGSLISLRGGPGGGPGAASTSNTIGTTSGSPSGTLAYPNGSVYQANSLGTRGVTVNPGGVGGALAGTGGTSPLGKGADGSNVTSSGNDATGYGSGGSGAINIGASASRPGGSGTGGLVIIWEYA